MVNMTGKSVGEVGRGLEVCGVTVRYDSGSRGRQADPPALRDVTVGGDPGEVVALLGPRGCGRAPLRP